MAYSPTTVLSTREMALGNRRLGQTVYVSSGKLGKSTLYLEPEISDPAVAAAATVIVEVYAVGMDGKPVGLPLASDSKPLSDLKVRGRYNFRTESDVPLQAAIVLRMEGGNSSNFVAWRYVSSDSTGQEMLLSSDGGASWQLDSARKFSYAAYSPVDNAIDSYNQYAIIQQGINRSKTDYNWIGFSGADFASVFDRTKIVQVPIIGDTVQVDFGTTVVTMVVDQSGSMTWNDNGGLRFEFLKDYIDDLESILPPGASASYSIVKFGARKVGTMTLLLQGGSNVGAELSGAKVWRTKQPAGSPVLVFEGFAEQFVDANLPLLSSGESYSYATYTYDSAGNYSDSRFGVAVPVSGVNRSPQGVAGFSATEQVILDGGISGDEDVGTRKVLLKWSNPYGYDYSAITLIKRTDRFATSVPDIPDPLDPLQGAVLLDSVPASTISYLDQAPQPAFVTGLTYYYSIFTKKSTGPWCTWLDARTASVKISEVNRAWEIKEPPDNVPPIGFPGPPYQALPANPINIVTTLSSGGVQISWSPGVESPVRTRRFRLFHHPNRFPQPGTPANGIQTYDGELLYDGTGKEFTHRNLLNGQPNFYVLVAVDTVGDQCPLPPAFTARPESSLTDIIPPLPVSDFVVDPQNQASVLLTWKLPVTTQPSLSLYFGDTAKATSNVTFADSGSTKTSASFSIEETGARTVSPTEGGAAPDPATALVFSNAVTNDAESVSATVSTATQLSILNNMESAATHVRATLKVTEKSTGNLIREIVTPEATITFQNPFQIGIDNSPEQSITTVSFNAECNDEGGPREDINSVKGVYAMSGESFHATLTASYRGEALADNITLAVRILDADTGLPSNTLALPETVNGVALLRVSPIEDEAIDRSGQPTGEVVTKSSIDINLPPQDIPGKYVLEVTGTYKGYTRTVTLDVNYAPSLNIDIEAASFSPNGVDVAEQKAFVYFGPPDGSAEKKIPVPDLTVTDWSIRLVGGNAGGKARPFYSLDNVPGSGVKAYTSSGVARKVFFGPASDVEMAQGQATCTDGEMWVITCTAKSNGMTATASAAIELLPFEAPDNLDRILLRTVTGGGIAQDEIYADGMDQPGSVSVFEVVANPELDGDVSDDKSGVFFRNSILGLGGRVPSLKNGDVVTMYVRIVAGTNPPLLSNFSFKTNMTLDSFGVPQWVKTQRVTATVEGVTDTQSGKATFYVKNNAKVYGTVKQPPLGSETSNLIYPVDSISWQPSPAIVSLTCFTVVEVNGKSVPFSGGGGSLQGSTPPAFISFKEPLGA
jgi:hypothetical protein